MAAINPTNAATPQELAKPYYGDRHEVYAFAQNLSGDTWTLPGGGTQGARVRRYACENSTAAGSVRAGLVPSTGVFTFIGIGVSGFYLHLWMKG
jgi:hypothetical protein